MKLKISDEEIHSYKEKFSNEFMDHLVDELCKITKQGSQPYVEIMLLTVIESILNVSIHLFEDPFKGADFLMNSIRNRMENAKDSISELSSKYSLKVEIKNKETDETA